VSRAGHGKQAAGTDERAVGRALRSGQDDLAGRHFARALTLARACGDLPLAAHVAASSSHLTLQTGDTAGAYRWAQTGLDLVGQGPRIPALTARLHAMQARALAAGAQGGPAVRALEAAQSSLDTSADLAHPWLSPFDTAALASESALTLRDLDQYDEALTQAEQAVTLREVAQAARAQSTRSPSTPHVTTEKPTAYTPPLSRSQRSR
jgi:hypothetical protein